MNAISRREFFKKTRSPIPRSRVFSPPLPAAGLARTAGTADRSQTYPHRARIQQGEFAGLLKDMKAIGIELVELCSPSYKEFASLSDGKATRKVLDDHGMKCSSAHFTLGSLRTELPRQIQWAQDVGMTQIGTASLNGRVTNGMTTPDAVKRAADEYNKIAAETNKAGLQVFLHNEGFENSRLEDGRLTYPVLMEALDPDLVKMQFQMSSMLTIGDPIMYFTNHPGRFVSAHLQGVDVTQGMRASRAGGSCGQADAGGGRRRRRPGAGARRPWRRGGGGRAGRRRGHGGLAQSFAAAKVGGLKNYFIEQAWDLTVKSVAFLKALNTT